MVRFVAFTRYDNSNARREWGWQPAHDTVDEIAQDIVSEVRLHPRRYGLDDLTMEL